MNITGEDVGAGRLMGLETIGMGHKTTITRYSESTPEEAKSSGKDMTINVVSTIVTCVRRENRWQMDEPAC